MNTSYNQEAKRTPRTKHAQLLQQARQDAHRAASLVVTNWRDERPLTGYNDIKAAASQVLRENYSVLDVMERVNIAIEVSRAVFEPLLPEYTQRYGEEEIRRSWAIVTGQSLNVSSHGQGNNS